MPYCEAVRNNMAIEYNDTYDKPQVHKVAHYGVFWYVLSYYVRNVLKGYFIVGIRYEENWLKKRAL